MNWYVTCIKEKNGKSNMVGSKPGLSLVQNINIRSLVRVVLCNYLF